jgi:S-formylglutathione hydrolase FrmB
MNRRHDLDWLRVIAFGILIFFHSGMAFSSYEWHVKNYESSRLIDEVIQFLHQWRMPLLFFISGAAVWFAMEKYSAWKYFLERQKRLLLPLLFGMLVVIPPQVYCERIYQRQGYASFLDFYPTIFTSGSYPQGNLSWHHLWYIPYIWAFSMATLPLFLWLRSQPGRNFLKTFQAWLARPGVLFLLFIPSAVAEVILRPFYPGDACNLIADWANFAHKLTFFVAGFMLASGTELAEVIARRRNTFLSAAVIILFLLECVWHVPLRVPGIWYRCLSNFHIWMWILTGLGFARKYLASNSAALRYATNAVYPFYILHQTIIVMLALLLVYADLGLWTKYFLVLGGTVALTWGVYEFLVSRVNLLRVCFGMKPRRPSRPEQVPCPIAAELPLVERAAGRATTAGSCKSATAVALLTLVSSWGSTWTASGRVLPAQVPSPALAGNRLGIAEIQPAAVYLPPSYASGDKRYPVIYLLPNFNTPVWRYSAASLQGFRMPERLDQLCRGGRIPEIIVVIPNTQHLLGSSWFRNSTITGNWEDFITRDLIHYVDHHFRTLAHAGSRGVAGHGAGGTGALELGLKHPEIFSQVYAMSPALLTSEDIRWFTAQSEQDIGNWPARVSEWKAKAPGGARRAFALYMQARLNSSSRQMLFQALRVSSCAAVAMEPGGSFPWFDCPSASDSESGQKQPPWEEILGNWGSKLGGYLAKRERLVGITIEYGRKDEYEFIRRGAEALSHQMNDLGVTNRLALSQGGHDSTLGPRLEEMFVALANALQQQ